MQIPDDVTKVFNCLSRDGKKKGVQEIMGETGLPLDRVNQIIRAYQAREAVTEEGFLAPVILHDIWGYWLVDRKEVMQPGYQEETENGTEGAA